MPSYRQKKLQQKREAERRQTLVWTLIFLATLGISAYVWFHFPEGFFQSLMAEKGSPQETLPSSENHLAGKTSADIGRNYVRLNPVCEPERKRIAKQVSDVLSLIRSVQSEMPEYIRQKNAETFSDLDNGEICAQSEQVLDKIDPGAEMSSRGTPPFAIYFNLHSFRPGEQGREYSAALDFTHEKLHIELKYPNTVEGFVDEEIQIRRLVCENGIWPIVQRGDIKKLAAWQVQECENFRSKPEEAEGRIRKDYTEDYNRLSSF